MKKHYINAVLALLKEGSDLSVVLANLSTLLTRKGHTSLYVSILQGVTTELELQQKRTAPTVVVVKESDVVSHTDAITKALQSLGATDSPNVHTDPTLVGGFIVSFNNKRINASYKEKLVALYRSITA